MVVFNELLCMEVRIIFVKISIELSEFGEIKKRDIDFVVRMRMFREYM